MNKGAENDEHSNKDGGNAGNGAVDPFVVDVLHHAVVDGSVLANARIAHDVAELLARHVAGPDQGAADHTRLAKGTGLGLTLVKHIVETVHGGRLTAASEPGTGSTFTFELPTME